MKYLTPAPRRTPYRLRRALPACSGGSTKLAGGGAALPVTAYHILRTPISNEKNASIFHRSSQTIPHTTSKKTRRPMTQNPRMERSDIEGQIP